MLDAGSKPSLLPKAALILGVLSLPSEFGVQDRVWVHKFGQFCLKKQAEPEKRFGEGKEEVAACCNTAGRTLVGCV